MNPSQALENFNQDVVAKYQIYNSLFLTLPFKDVANTAVILPLLASHCEKGFEQGKDPRQIIDDFFNQHTELKTEQEKIDVLFRLSSSSNDRSYFSILSKMPLFPMSMIWKA